jgi:hypothetical protein
MKTAVGLCVLLLVVSGCALNPVRRNPMAMAWGFHGEGHAARASSHDVTGGNNDAVRIEAGATVILAELSGPGIIRHIWCTTNATGPAGRSLVLRMYWDGASVASVEAPLGDFFGVGNAVEANLQSWPISVGSKGRSRNCWWPMPFSKGARITLTNDSSDAVNAFYYYVDYLALHGPPPTRERFHARYTQAHPADFPENYTLLRTEGRGHYVGCAYSVRSLAPQWWGEGDDIIIADEHPPLLGTGTEDYFCDAWGMRETHALFHGSPVCEGYAAAGLRSSMVRFHILDPIPFRKRIHVAIEHGHGNDRADDFSSVAFWYQEPPFPVPPPLPPLLDRLTGDDRNGYLQRRALALASSDDPASLDELEVLAGKTQSPEMLTLLRGLRAYNQGRREPTRQSLDALDVHLGALADRISRLPEDQQYAAPRIDLPTDDDAPVPAEALVCRAMLERTRHDLARRVALARGFLPGDELVVEARDAQGRLTPPPDYQDTPDFTNSYAKADDTRLMGSGARFTYGNAEPSWARFTPAIPRTGRYEVLTLFSYGANADDTRYEIRHADGRAVIPLAQRGRPDTPERNNAAWHSLGVFRFEQGRNPDQASVTLHAGPGTAAPNPTFEYRAYADAVRFVFRGD